MRPPLPSRQPAAPAPAEEEDEEDVAGVRAESGSSSAGWDDRKRPPAPNSSQRSSHTGAGRDGEAGESGGNGGNGSWVEGSGRSAEGGAEINEIDKRLQALHAFLRAAKEGEEHAAS